jgi:hypothetical protein
MTAKTPTMVWLERARITDDPEGDLIADMRAEMNAGRAVPDLGDLIGKIHAHLRLRNACEGAHHAVGGVRRRFRRWLDRHCWDWEQLS